MTLGEKLLKDFKELPLHLQEKVLIEIKKIYEQRKNK